jgi:chaperonin GroEL (HSP60 family)
MNQADREIIISIVSRAFEQNPRMLAMLKRRNPARSIRPMTEYAYRLAASQSPTSEVR